MRRDSIRRKIGRNWKSWNKGRIRSIIRDTRFFFTWYLFNQLISIFTVKFSIEKKYNYNFSSESRYRFLSFFLLFLFFFYAFKAAFILSTMAWHIRTPSSSTLRPTVTELFIAISKYTSLMVSKVSTKLSIGAVLRRANCTASLRTANTSDEPSSNAFATWSRAARICDLTSFEYFARFGNFNRSSADLSTLVKLTVPKLPFATATKWNIFHQNNHSILSFRDRKLG